jgi:hypothetical protein
MPETIYSVVDIFAIARTNLVMKNLVTRTDATVYTVRLPEGLISSQAT